jgi:hypothetical protein
MYSWIYCISPHQLSTYPAFYLMHGNSHLSNSMEQSFLGKLISSKKVKKFQVLCGPECSLPHSQESAIYPYPAPDQASPFLLIPLPEDPILILTYSLRPGLPSGLFPSDFPTKTLYAPLLSRIRSTCPSHLGIIVRHIY